jgi:hypothetical protein
MADGLTPPAPTAVPHSAHSAGKRERAVGILHTLFNLRHQQLVADYSCAISEQILLHGRLYVTSDAACFYSSIFGHETRKILPFSKMVEVRARQSLLVLPMLEFVMRPRAPGGEEKTIVFTSFFGSSRDEAYELCLQLRARHRKASDDVDGGAGVAMAAAFPRSTSAGKADSTRLDTTAPAVPVEALTADLAPAFAASASALAADGCLQLGSGGGSSCSGGGGGNVGDVGEFSYEHGPHDEGDAEAVAAETPSNDSPLLQGSALVADDIGLGLGPSHSFPSASPALWDRLSKSQVVCDAVLPLSVAGFHGSFLADDATLSLSDFQKNRGNVDANLTSWVLSRGAAPSCSLERERSTSDHVRRGAASSSFDGDSGGVLSPSSSNGGDGESSEFSQPFLSRTLRMTMPVDGGPFVAKHTAVEVVQRLLAFSWPEGGATDAAGAGSMLVLDQSAQSFDVPFGDSFLTEETWLVLPASPNAAPLPLHGHENLSATTASSTSPADAPMCRFVSLVSVNFIKSCWLKELIVSKTISATRESTAAFAEAAKGHAAEQHLQVQLRAEQQELPRQRRQQRLLHEARLPERSPLRPLGSTPALSFAREAVLTGADNPSTNQPALPQAPCLESKLQPQTSSAEDALFSPSLEAALRLPRLPRDALMETLLSPQSLLASPRDDLVRAYTQLYAAHAAAISQVRALQVELTALRAGGKSTNESKSPSRRAEEDSPRALFSAVGPGGSPLLQLGVLLALLLAATAAAVLFAACGGTTLVSCPHLLATPRHHHRPEAASASDEDLANRVVERVLATLAAAAAAAVARNEGPGPGLGAAAGAAGGAGTGAGARGLQ